MTQNPAAPQLSVVLITLNEEARILACLESLPAGAEIIVLDSGSIDRTRELASAFGARVEVRAFDNYASQKNAAVALASRPWVFSIDADEVVGPELAASLAEVTASAATPVVAYRVRRRLVFMGRPLRFGKAIDRPARLFRRGLGHFESAIHERLEVTGGSSGSLSGELLHYSYADLSDYFRRFNLYTSRIAENHARAGRRLPLLPLHALRPWLEFLYRYIIRLGFLDGYAGYTYALVSSLYTYIKYAKLREILVSKGSS
jgi:glycosyltransferase involved in cell wall biosynthesis